MPETVLSTSLALSHFILQKAHHVSSIINPISSEETKGQKSK